MLDKFSVIAGLVGVLSGCALFEEVAPASQEGYFEPKSTANQDPYWQRFYELEKEIAHLKAQLGSPRADHDGSASASTQSATNQAADDFLARLHSKTNAALQVIDQAIASLEAQEPIENQSAVAEYGVTSVNSQVAVAGRVQRSDDGAVVGQATHSQPRQSGYNYSLVYVYPEPRPWNEMWEKLEAANEQDKWRGSNPEKPSYFIYVGAYIKESDAISRHDNLVSLLGEGPEMRANVRTSALASN